MTTETQYVGYRYRGVARYGGYRRYGGGTYNPYGYRRYGYGTYSPYGYRRYGYGTYSPYGYRRYGYGVGRGIARRNIREESSGSDTPTEPSREGWTRQRFRLGEGGLEETSNGQRTARHGAAAPRDRAPAEDAERIADQSARRAGTDKAMRGGEQGRWCASGAF